MNARGDAPPENTVTGSKTGLLGNDLQSIAVGEDGTIYVAYAGGMNDADFGVGHIALFAAGSTGNAAPTAEITIPPGGLAEGLSLHNGKLFLAQGGTNPQIDVYSTPSLQLESIISGDPPFSGISKPAFDSSSSILETTAYVGPQPSNAIFKLASGSSGAATPTDIIEGPATMLDSYGPSGIAVDSIGRIIVSALSSHEDEIFSFASTATGDSAPLAMTTDTSGLGFPNDIVVGPDDSIYVAESGQLQPNTGGIAVFSAGAGPLVGSISGPLVPTNNPISITIGVSP